MRSSRGLEEGLSKDEAAKNDARHREASSRERRACARFEQPVTTSWTHARADGSRADLARRSRDSKERARSESCLWKRSEDVEPMKRIFIALAGAALFLANMLYVAASRTALVVIAGLLLLFGLRQFGWRGALGALLVGGVLAGGAWVSSPYLRERIGMAIEQVQTHGTGDLVTPVGLRLEFWRTSLALVAEAPAIGHGTGTIAALFRRAEANPALVTPNPHNQILTVAIQLGAVGAIALAAMWLAHLVLFGAATAVAWLGLVVVVQNILGSLFNSHLFDFGHGWLYVVAVGVAGGAVLRAAAPADAGAET